MLRPIHLCAVIGVNLIFAGAYLAGKLGVDHFPPLFFSALRFLLAFVFLLPFFRLPSLPRRHIRPFVLFCLTMGVGVYSTLYLALASADGVSGILIGTQFSVPIAALLGVWLLGDKTDRVIWLGILLAFSGVLFVGFDSTLLGYWRGFLLILVSAFFYAYANVLSQQLGGVVGILNLNAWMALLSTPLMLIASLVLEDDQWQVLQTADSGAWAALLYSSLAVSLLGHGGMFALLRRYPVAAIMPYYVLTPIFGVCGGILLFDEEPSSKFYIGSVIALTGVWLVNRHGRRTTSPLMKSRRENA